MSSPFPGMDPYLEQYWRDVHHSLCTYARDALQPQVRPKLLARLDERLVVEADDRAPPRSIYPDVRLEEFRGGGPIPAGAAVGDNEPMVLTYAGDEPQHEGFVRITDPANGDTLVTVIEFLSPSNKRTGDDQQQYRRKQSELVEAGVSLVEIDLLREGSWVLQIPIGQVPRARRGPYNVCVHRAWVYHVYEVYSVAVARPLPKVRIPLRQGDADAVLDLQAIVNQAYENGAYGDAIDYAADADPPLTGEAASWADELLRKAGRRPA